MPRRTAYIAGNNRFSLHLKQSIRLSAAALPALR